jgi:hypothetical protein
MTYPYTLSPDRLKSFILKIPTTKIPQKVDTKYLKSLGYTSSNDSRILTVLKFIGVLEKGGTPTDLWGKLRDKSEGPKALATAIQTQYCELFAVHPNAHEQDAEALRTFFRAHTGVGEQAVNKMVSTFRALCSIADFSAASPEVAPEQPQQNKAEEAAPVHASASDGGKNSQEAAAKTMSVKSSHDSEGSPLTIHINLQLHLPQDTTGDVYDKLFAAMRKHLPLG